MDYPVYISRENAQRVAQIDEHIASLEHTIAFLKMERTNLRHKSGSRHPLFTPELLASIIEWGIFMRAFEPDDVMAVSTFWRQVVLQTPALWSRIIMTDLPSQEHIGPRMKRFLERSKDHVLHIELSVSESSWGAWRYEDTLDDLAKLLRPHMRRCVYYSLGRGFDSFTMLQLVTELNPDVECISLWDFSFGGQSDAIMGGMRVRDQKAANLTYIRGPLHYDVFVGIHFPVLKHLELTDEAPVEWEMLLNLLTNTPVLITLIIVKQELQLSAHSNLTPVALPLLTTLRLVEWSTENLSLFFTYVSTPGLQELALLKTPAHAFPLDLIKQVKKLELPANSNTGWTARVLRRSTEVEELTMTSTTATREVLELLANQLEGNAGVQPGLRTWLLPKMVGMEVDCLSVSGYNRVPVQELRGVLRRRRLGGVREVTKLTLHGVEESEVERVKGELDGEVERLEVLLQSKLPALGPARPWIPRRRRRSTSPIIIGGPRRPRHLPYIPARRYRSRSWDRSPSQRSVSMSPRGYTSPRRVSLENESFGPPIVVLPPRPLLRPPSLVILPPPPLRSRPASPSWRARYAPSTERPTIIRPEERSRSRSPRRRRTYRSRSPSPLRQPPVVLPPRPLSRSRCVVVMPPSPYRGRPASPSRRARYAPSSTERPTIIRTDEGPRGRSPHRTPTSQSRSPWPPRRPPVIFQVPQDSPQEQWRVDDEVIIHPLPIQHGTGILPEASYVHSPPPNQPANAAQDDRQDGPSGVTTFGRIPRRRSYRTSPLFSPRYPSPTYTSPRSIQLTTSSPISSHPAFSTPQGLGSEESRDPPYHLPYQYGGRPATPPVITRQSYVPAPPPPIEPTPTQTRPWLSSPRLEQRRPHVVTGSAPWLNGPAYDHPMARFIPNETHVPAVQNPPEPMVVQVPGHPSTRVVARAVRRTVTPPLHAFGHPVPPAQQICSGFVLQMPATQAAVPPCVVVSSNT